MANAEGQQYNLLKILGYYSCLIVWWFAGKRLVIKYLIDIFGKKKTIVSMFNYETQIIRHFFLLFHICKYSNSSSIQQWRWRIQIGRKWITCQNIGLSIRVSVRSSHFCLPSLYPQLSLLFPAQIIRIYHLMDWFCRSKEPIFQMVNH